MFDETGVIGTTGPEMRRFFFSVDEAVQLVLTALDRRQSLRGKVLARRMKAAQIQDMLDTWIGIKGGAWRRIEGRPGERQDEFLIGELELAYTCEEIINGFPHYITSFNERVHTPLAIGLSSANTERLTRDEMAHIINNPPVEEQ